MDVRENRHGLNETAWREVVIARGIDPEIWEMDLPAPTRDAITDFHARRRKSIATARSILAALKEAGMVILPEKPTPEMLGAWYRYKSGFRYQGEPAATDTSDYGAYAAMLAAAQEQEGE